MLTIVPDTNVLLHGKALAELPWRELSDDEILIVIAGPVVRELDRHKNGSGRSRRRAVQASALVRELMTEKERKRIISGTSPSIAVEAISGLGAHRPMDPRLDLTHPDQSLINFCLGLSRDGRNVLLLTDDTFAAMAAEEVGLPCKLLPSHWLGEPTPDDATKKARQAEDEIRRLREQEPKFEIQFTCEGAPVERLQLSIKYWPELPASRIETLVEQVRSLCPLDPATLARISPAPAFPRWVGELDEGDDALDKVEICPTEAEAQEYREKFYAGWLVDIVDRFRDLPIAFSSLAGWPQICIETRNVGSRPAELAMLSFEGVGGVRLREPASRNLDIPVSHRLGPLPLPPPYPRSRWIPRHMAVPGVATAMRYLQDIENLQRRDANVAVPLPTLPAEPRPDAIRKRRRIGVNAPWIFDCQCWRHQTQQHRASVDVRAERTADVLEGAIRVTAHANNLPKPSVKTLPIAIRFEQQDTFLRATEILAEFAAKVARLADRVA